MSSIYTKEEQQILKDVYAYEKKREEENLENMHKIFEELSSFLSVDKIECLLNFILDDCMEVSKMEIVDKSKVFGHRQTENFWFKYIYIQQDVGYLGDDFFGTIFIPLKVNTFLKFEYSC